MSDTRHLEEPWNLPPVPGFCGNPLLHWAEQTPEARKAEWMRQPRWWHETVGRERVEYWRARSS